MPFLLIGFLPCPGNSNNFSFNSTSSKTAGFSFIKIIFPSSEIFSTIIVMFCITKDKPIWFIFKFFNSSKKFVSIAY